MRTLIAATAMCAAMAATAAGDDHLTLVDEGRALGAILVRADAGPSEQWAAEELRDHVKAMSGAELPILHAVPSTALPMVVLGDMGRDVGVQVDTSGLGGDGFVVKAEGSILAVVGGKKRGTLYGVYTLLEDLGVRWWTPSETFIPKTATVMIPATDRRVVPKLEYRDMMYQEMWDKGAKLWAARNRVNGFCWQTGIPENLGGRYEFANNLVHGHAATVALSGRPITEDMKALVGGKRTRDQFCLTNEAVFEATVEGVLKAYEKNPGIRFVVIGQADNRNYCRCEKCAAINEREESTCGANLWLANRVAEEVEKRRPGSAVCTAAYEWSRKPPKTLKPRDNVYITLCSIECDFAHPLATAVNEVNAAFRRDMEGWGRIAKKIYIWDYTTNFRMFLAPFPNVDVLVPNVKFFADNGAAGVFEQGAHTGRGSDMVELKMWLLAKALWNPDADAKALVKEFCDGYYGLASEAVQQYLDVMHGPARRQNFVMRIYSMMDMPYQTPEVLAEAAVAMNKAYLAVGDDPVLKRRVRHAMMPVVYMLLKRGPAGPTWKAVEGKLGEGKMTPVAEEFAKTVEEYRINAIADHEVVQAFVKWAQHYAELCDEKGGAPIPPELEGKDPATYHVIQACQMDTRGRWYEPAEGASDGWCIQQPSVGWTIRSVFAAGEHFTPGKTYALRLRVRGTPEPDAGAKPAWYCGVSSGGKYPAQARFNADQVTGQWQVVDVGTWKVQNGDNFYIAIRDAKVMKAIYLDCMWLEEAE